MLLKKEQIEGLFQAFFRIRPYAMDKGCKQCAKQGFHDGSLTVEPRWARWSQAQIPVRWP